MFPITPGGGEGGGDDSIPGKPSKPDDHKPGVPDRTPDKPIIETPDDTEIDTTPKDQDLEVGPAAIKGYKETNAPLHEDMNNAAPVRGNDSISPAALLVADKLPGGDKQKPVVERYSRTYQAKAGQAVSTFGGHAYDGFMILLEAMQRAKSADSSKVRDEIERTKGYVGTGGIVNMSATDHMGLDLSALRVLEIKSGDWTLIPDT